MKIYALIKSDNKSLTGILQNNSIMCTKSACLFDVTRDMFEYERAQTTVESTVREGQITVESTVRGA